MVALKKTLACLDCGNSDWRVLDFDHVADNKDDSVSNMLKNGHSWDTIEAEIAKCEPVCSNCHRIRTYERRETKKRLAEPAGIQPANPRERATA